MIMNIESFNISKNVLYKLINKINPVRFRSIAGGLALLSILALPGCSLLEPEKMPPKPANPTGVSGKHDPNSFSQKHMSFGKARRVPTRKKRWNTLTKH